MFISRVNTLRPGIEAMFPSGIDFNIVFTALALIVSLVTLWFSHLKGPDLELCRPPEAVLKDWTERDVRSYLSQDYIPDYLELDSVELLFVNNGSRAGAVTDIKGEFEPSESFQPFFKQSYVGVPLDPDVREPLPVSIPEGGNSLIELRVSLHVIDWKEEFRFGEVSDTSNLRKAFTESIELNKRDLERLIGFLASGESLGKLRISASFLARRWLKTRLTIKEIAEVEVQNKAPSVAEGYSSLIKDWDTDSIVNRHLSSLPRVFDACTSKVDDHLSVLRRHAEPKTIQVLADLRRDINILYNRRYLEKALIDREKRLMEKLHEYSSQVDRFNSLASILVSARDTLSDTQIKELNELREKTLESAEDTLAAFGELKGRLLDEIKV